MASRYGLEIRAAARGDVPGLAEVLAEAGCAIAPAALAERLSGLNLAAGAALIAAEWGPPSGLVVLHWYRSLGAAQPIAQITTLLVRPEDRRRGIGRLLLKAAAQAARTAGCGGLELLAPGAGAPSLEAFCQATGFTAQGGRFGRPLRKGG